MKASADFWREQEKWPRDTSEMTFLARAVDQLGCVILGDQWTGQEPQAETLPLFKVLTDKRWMNNLIARHLVQFGRTEYHLSLAPPPTGHDDHRPTFLFSEEETKALHDFIEQNNEVAKDAKESFQKVQNMISDNAAEGKLRTAYRANGEFHPIKSTWWNWEGNGQRFTLCRIDPQNPFGPGQNALIFVSRPDLEKLTLSRQEVTTIQSTPQEPIVSGRGKTDRLIKSTFKKLYPNGLPDGVTSTARDEAIRANIRASLGNHAVPSQRTIQKALQTKSQQ